MRIATSKCLWECVKMLQHIRRWSFVVLVERLILNFSNCFMVLMQSTCFLCHKSAKIWLETGLLWVPALGLRRFLLRSLHFLGILNFITSVITRWIGVDLNFRVSVSGGLCSLSILCLLASNPEMANGKSK